jgi:hypothetical protein
MGRRIRERWVGGPVTIFAGGLEPEWKFWMIGPLHGLLFVFFANNKYLVCNFIFKLCTALFLLPNIRQSILCFTSVYNQLSVSYRYSIARFFIILYRYPSPSSPHFPLFICLLCLSDLTDLDVINLIMTAWCDRSVWNIIVLLVNRYVTIYLIDIQFALVGSITIKSWSRWCKKANV